MGVGTVGGSIPVDQDEIRGRVQRLDSAPHGEHGRLEDIEGIDGLFLDHAEADGHRVGPDRQVELLASVCAERLGVIHSINCAGRRKDHGGSHNRSGQGSTPGLINTRNEVTPLGTEAGLYLCGQQRSDPL